MLSQTLNHIWIASHIPHQGKMCLLDRVEAWTQEHITCIATSHHASDNPLRAHNQLGVACGVEYAAQAMAVHGALLAPADSPKPKVGYLVSVRGVTMLVNRLDDITADLLIVATCMMASETNMLYEFSVSANDRPSRHLLQGRAAVMIDAGALAFTQ